MSKMGLNTQNLKAIGTEIFDIKEPIGTDTINIDAIKQKIYSAVKIPTEYLCINNTDSESNLQLKRLTNEIKYTESRIAELKNTLKEPKG